MNVMLWDKGKAKGAQWTSGNGIYFLGLDLGLVTTGVALLRTDGMSTGVIEPKGLKGAQRLYHIRELLKGILSMQEGEGLKCAGVGLEGYAMGAKGQAFTMGELGGVVRLLLWEHKFKMFVIAPSTLKKFLTGSGGAGVKKANMMKIMYQRYDLDIDGDDEVDAAACALVAHAVVTGAELEGPKTRSDALKKVLAVGGSVAPEQDTKRPGVRRRTRSLQ